MSALSQKRTNRVRPKFGFVRFGPKNGHQFRKEIFYSVVTDYGSASFLPRYNRIGSQRRAHARHVCLEQKCTRTK